MLHHLSIAVVDLTRAATFYDAALAPLGYVRVFADDKCIGYGYPGGGDKFAIKLRSNAVAPGSGSHIDRSALRQERVSAARSRGASRANFLWRRSCGLIPLSHDHQLKLGP